MLGAWHKVWAGDEVAEEARSKNKGAPREWYGGSVLIRSHNVPKPGTPDQESGARKKILI
jgi:hypothetical protein